MRAVQRRFQDLGATVDINSQARVDLGDEQRFGRSFAQLPSAKAGVDRCLIAATCIGLDVQSGKA
ncbi:hypothetical protein [Pseudomonas sp. PH1b]|uniref:hypothetical protein n=1 Tax=Pseudomonas sp. PH1b TaxID=1397282 RepID=UPI00352795AA